MSHHLGWMRDCRTAVGCRPNFLATSLCLSRARTPRGLAFARSLIIGQRTLQQRRVHVVGLEKANRGVRVDRVIEGIQLQQVGLLQRHLAHLFGQPMLQPGRVYVVCPEKAQFLPLGSVFTGSGEGDGLGEGLGRASVAGDSAAGEAALVPAFSGAIAAPMPIPTNKETTIPRIHGHRLSFVLGAGGAGGVGSSVMLPHTHSRVYLRILSANFR
jgi:hypothetical protein